MNLKAFTTTDRPVPYKNLLVHSVTVRDYMEFLWCVDCLLIDKNAIPDIQVISMSYLQFLFHLSDEGNSVPLQQLIFLLAMTLKVATENIKVYKRDDGKPYFSINDDEYDNYDLLEIKKIILFQNDIDDIDDTIQKELRDAFKEAAEYRARLSGSKPGDLEDNIVSLMVALQGLTLDDIYNLPIRKFNRALQRADHKLHYEIYLAAQMSGMVTFKDKSAIKHWMCSLDEKDKYKDVKMGMDELQGKVAIDKK